eukprot:TRINITY_DN21601_c0_g1_i1.p2 TRINITY_DN21601_c0_g1~~TRINITY_DN21601_c0_g1_i1.p2  ORF type:complete len:110 (+),score=26.66 TRINITY_DN21601_c0_g1_i1:142-471(+)
MCIRDRPPTLSSTLPLLSAPGAGSLAQFSSDGGSKKSTIRLALDIIHGGVVVGGRMSGGGMKEEDKKRRPMILTPGTGPVSYTHLRAHETPEHLVCRLLLEKKKITILS